MSEESSPARESPPGGEARGGREGGFREGGFREGGFRGREGGFRGREGGFRGREGGFRGRGRGRGFGDRAPGDRPGGPGRAGRRKGGPPGEGDDKREWIPVTKLGRLVKDGKIKSLEQIYLFSIPIKEHEIVDYFLKGIKDEVMRIMPVQKQTAAGQRTRFKAYVIVGDQNGHVGLGYKVSKEVATAIRGAIIDAKLSVVPVRRGYWGNNIGKVHTVPMKVTGKCGSVRVRLIPAPRGTGVVAAKVPKKVLGFCGIDDCWTSTEGNTKTVGNLVRATFDAIDKTYAFLSPNLWKETKFIKPPFQEFTDYLAKSGKQNVKVGS